MYFQKRLVLHPLNVNDKKEEQLLRQFFFYQAKHIYAHEDPLYPVRKYLVIEKLHWLIAICIKGFEEVK